MTLDGSRSKAAAAAAAAWSGVVRAASLGVRPARSPSGRPVTTNAPDDANVTFTFAPTTSWPSICCCRTTFVPAREPVTAAARQCRFSVASSGATLSAPNSARAAEPGSPWAACWPVMKRAFRLVSSLCDVAFADRPNAPDGAGAMPGDPVIASRLTLTFVKFRQASGAVSAIGLSPSAFT